jgi:hypothetical protein
MQTVPSVTLRGLASLAVSAFLVASTSGCAARDPTAARTGDEDTREAFTPNFDQSHIAAIYRPFIFRHDLEGNGKMEKALQALPYASITLSRSSCFGTCPEYTVTFRRDLSAELKGVQFIEPLGTTIGHVSAYAYARLCCMIDEMHFTSFRPSYDAGWTDDAASTVTVTTATGRVIAVRDYGRVGPVSLQALIAMLDAARVEMTREGADKNE